MFNIANILKRPLILDGAMGSYLQQCGVKADKRLWLSSALIDRPEEVVKVHKAYIEAGADIITTNTFRTNPSAVNTTKYSSHTLAGEAVKLARDAVGKNKVFIAGSNPPAEDCYQRERKVRKKTLEKNHIEHIDLLTENGVSFILNETQSHFDEIEIICRHCSENNIPFILSIFIQDDELKIFSGEKLIDVIDFVHDFSPIAIGFNCIKPKVFSRIYKIIDPDLSWGFYLNCGAGNYSDKKVECGVSPKEYSGRVKKYLNKKPFFIGACCGSSPSHIAELKKIF